MDEDWPISDIPSHAAPAGGRLTERMLSDFKNAGVLVLRDFVSVDACDALRARAEELVDAFDPQEVRSVFSTTEQTQLDDDY
ncbi:MAG: phytanoyl-CoA dioxygenase family protein, partial [Gammaproteobacteria bacterium]|nr:phytanoyl-CoA dioxygenase family protein [Gammaproteobacteria bacterium]